MNDQTYNGWTNYATWRVNLEVFDGMDLRHHFETIPDVYDVSQWAREHTEQYIEGAFWQPVNPGRSSDLTACDIVDGWARAFIADVDWHMIASHLIENASEVAA